MLIVAIAWIYVVLMMALAEALGPQGSVLGSVITFVLYGVLPLSIVLYLMSTPARRRARRRQAEQPPADTTPGSSSSGSMSSDPDGRGHPPGDAVPPVREEA